MIRVSITWEGNRRVAALLVICLLILLGNAARAQDRVIKEIDPSVIQQGDTVLLTIRGENLPVGTVAVDFFPQQIAVLDILSASDTEVVAQIKVPSLVAPGAYNVVLYNHLGDEAFGEGLLTIASDIITPVFRDYDPKVIAQATKGFALLLTGESITEEAAAHLKMRWFQGDRELSGLNSMFSSGGPGQVVCAVTGDLPGGKLQGKVYLDDKPIYLVEINIESPTGIIVGHSPSQLNLSDAPYTLTLIGSDLTQDFAGLLDVELASDDTVAKSQAVTLQDAAAISAVFNGPLPAGDYELRALRMDDVVYSGQVELVEKVTAPEAPPAPPETGPPEAPPSEQPQPKPPGGKPPAPPPELSIDSVAPLTIPADAKAASLVINGTGLGAAVAERLQLQLAFDQQQCQLLFLGAGRQNLTCLFAPPEGGWPAGGSGTLTITDPDGAIDEFVATLKVTALLTQESQAAVNRGAEQPAAGGTPSEVEAGQPAAVWEAGPATLQERDGQTELQVKLTTDDQNWDPRLLSGSFNLLPDDPLLPQLFGNVTRAGDLVFSRLDAQTAEATCAGYFVPGDLLVEFRYSMGAESAAMLRLNAEPPHGVVTAPRDASIRIDSGSGELTPDTINWSIDFAPFDISKPDIISIDFDPPPADPGAAADLQTEGTELSIAVHPAAWRGLIGAGGTLRAKLSTTIQLELVGDLTLEVPVEGSDVSEKSSGISFAESVAVASDQGLEFELAVSDPAIAIDQLADVQLNSDNLLLALNAGEFQVKVDSPGGDRSAVRMSLLRNPQSMTDVSYGLLVDELLGAEDVELILEWPGLGRQLSGKLRFIRAAEDTPKEQEPVAGQNENDQP